ncbi:MAG TPA: DUF192 domain-containing protein [Anaerolineales bacterium]|nr:DUF192 domain-containing protein [Anaerolineales bacterium]
MRLLHKPSNTMLLADVKWCNSFLCRLRGLMFRSSLREGEGLLLVERRESRMDTSIHMFFMSFPIAAVWLDARFRVVDTCLARPWRPFYAPCIPAQYTLEASPELLKKISTGDELAFEN